MHALEDAQHAFQQQHQEFDPQGTNDRRCWAYVNDLTCILNERHAAAWLVTLETACARAGLQLNVDKTQVYLPRNLTLPC